jgi:hypothetical protein
MKKFISGVISGSIGSLLIYVLITFFVEPLRFNLSYGFTPVSGKYLSSYPDHPNWKSEPITVNQFGFKIYGDFFSPEDKEHYDFTGNVTSSRLITYQFSPKNKRLNDYGAGLIKLNKNGGTGEGYVLFLSEKSERPKPIRIIIKKIDNK